MRRTQRYRVYYRIANSSGFTYESGDYLLPQIRDAASLGLAETELSRLVCLSTDLPSQVRINDYEPLAA